MRNSDKALAIAIALCGAVGVAYLLFPAYEYQVRVAWWFATVKYANEVQFWAEIGACGAAAGALACEIQYRWGWTQMLRAGLARGDGVMAQQLEMLMEPVEAQKKAVEVHVTDKHEECAKEIWAKIEADGNPFKTICEVGRMSAAGAGAAVGVSEATVSRARTGVGASERTERTDAVLFEIYAREAARMAYEGDIARFEERVSACKTTLQGG